VCVFVCGQLHFDDDPSVHRATQVASPRVVRVCACVRAHTCACVASFTLATAPLRTVLPGQPRLELQCVAVWRSVLHDRSAQCATQDIL